MRLIPKLRATDKRSDKLRCDAFEVDAVFRHSDIARQRVFMHPAEGAQKIANPGPHTFGGVDMDFSDTIAIIIPRPFVFPMLDGDALALNRVVALPFISVRHGIGLGEARHVAFQSFAIGMFDDAQADLPALASDRAHNGRPIIVVGAMAFLFVGPPARGIRRIAVFFALFPPHSETFHRFQ